LLDIAGIGKERLHLAWVSSAEAHRFVEIVTGVTESIKNQGKFDPDSFIFELDAAETTLASETLRWLVGKEVKITTHGDVYGRNWDKESFEAIIDSALEREYQMNFIFQAIKEGCKSVRDISSKIGLDLMRVSYLLADMEKRSIVEFTGMEDRKPVFAAL
jgi:predicted transcriptional regulator